MPTATENTVVDPFEDLLELIDNLSKDNTNFVEANKPACPETPYTFQSENLDYSDLKQEAWRSTLDVTTPRDHVKPINLSDFDHPLEQFDSVVQIKKPSNQEKLNQNSFFFTSEPEKLDETGWLSFINSPPFLSDNEDLNTIMDPLIYVPL